MNFEPREMLEMKSKQLDAIPFSLNPIFSHRIEMSLPLDCLSSYGLDVPSSIIVNDSGNLRYLIGMLICTCGESVTNESWGRVRNIFMYKPGHPLDLGHCSGIKNAVFAT